ncbi:MAG: hypothetical protein AAFQ94_29605, partial [Bacteroidota bacterium]
ATSRLSLHSTQLTVNLVIEETSTLEVEELIVIGEVYRYAIDNYWNNPETLACEKLPPTERFFVKAFDRFIEISNYTGQSSFTIFNTGPGGGSSGSFNTNPIEVTCDNGNKLTLNRTFGPVKNNVTIRFMDPARGGHIYTWSNGLGTGITKVVSPDNTTTYTVSTTINSQYFEGEVTVIVNTGANANAGEDDDVCALSYQLQGTVDGGQSGSWSLLSGPGIATFSDSSLPNSGVTVSEFGTYVFQWTLTVNGSCTSGDDQVEISFSDLDFDISVDNSCPLIGDPVVLNITQYQSGLTYEVNWGDGTIENTTAVRVEHYYVIGNFNISVSSSNGSCSVTKNLETISVSYCNTYAKKIESNNGQFKIDKLTGSIFFESESCGNDLPFTCFVGPSVTIPNVISANAIVISNEWNYSDYLENTDYLISDNNEFENAIKGKYRPANTYSYNTNEINRDRNYNTGTYHLNMFNYNNPESVIPKWIKASTVTKYSVNGDPLEELNALQIASSVKYGYDNAVPYLTASNASYDAILFESFENLTDALESDLVYDNSGIVTENVSHGGNRSLSITESTVISTPNMSMTNDVDKVLLQFWVRNYDQLFSVSGLNIQSISVNKKLSTGEWSLYSAEVTVLDKTNYQLRFSPSSSFAGTIAIDDIRIQPIDAEMTCYVYDPFTLRLTTIFDDQHFAMFYQYNEEGKLLRKLIETERGIKTLQETYYNSYNQTNE